MDCETCKEKRKVIAQTPKVARLERVIKRLWVLVLVLIVLLAASNAAWIWWESQFEEVRIEQDNESGYNNFIGNDGDIYNGEADNNSP